MVSYLAYFVVVPPITIGPRAIIIAIAEPGVILNHSEGTNGLLFGYIRVLERVCLVQLRVDCITTQAVFSITGKDILTERAEYEPRV